MVVVLGIADCRTGSDLVFSVFYLFPLGLAAWYVHRNLGVVLTVLSAFSWYLADMLARQDPQSNAFIPAWNIGVRQVTFLAVATLLAVLRATFEREAAHAQIDRITGAANA